VALGKLGGRSLGYAGDLDLLFLYEGEGAEAAHEATRLAQRVLFLLNVPLEGGALYEVDTRLRPDGSQGALVSSLAGFAAYHAERAGLWERLALVRGRPVAGSAALRARASRVLQAAVWEVPLAVESAAAAAEIARLRARLEREIAREDPAHGRYNVKAGRGGVLDLEFLVQFLQLQHGARRSELRVTETLEAIERLGRARLLGEDDVALARTAYDFLRRLESRIRIVQDRASDELPVAPAALTKLARRLGYGGGGARPPGEALLADYRRTREAVRALCERALGPIA
jgi:glutamate-ammonia-ligase adenylyltransferase